MKRQFSVFSFQFSVAAILAVLCLPSFGAASTPNTPAFNLRAAAQATCNAGITATATTVVVSSGQGATNIPLPGPNTFMLIYNATDFPVGMDDPLAEIIGVTAIATDTLTISRGQFQTPIGAHNIGGKTYKLAPATIVSPVSPIDATVATTAYSAGGGTAKFKTGGVINSQFTETGNGADQTEDTLLTFSLPANTLSTVGTLLKCKVFGKYLNNGDNKQVKFYFGSEVIASGVVTSNNKNWSAEIIVIKSGSSTQQVYQNMVTDTTTITGVFTAATETDTGAITIKVTGQGTTGNTANEVKAEGMTVEFYPQ